jgi:hypothetical protein
MYMFQLLIERGGNIDVEDKQRRTVFHHAATARDYEVFDWPVDHEDDAVRALNKADIHGWAPLHWACRSDRGRHQIDRLLEMADSATLTAATDDGWTPENIATYHDAEEIMEVVGEALSSSRSSEQDKDEQSSLESNAEPWSLGSAHPGRRCDGCSLSVSQAPVSTCQYDDADVFLANLRNLLGLPGLLGGQFLLQVLLEQG